MIPQKTLIKKKIHQTEHELENSYAPSTLLNIFPQLLGKMISVRGKYEKNTEITEEDAETETEKPINLMP